MPKPRKTYPVADLVRTANGYLANTAADAEDFRMGVIVTLESVLMVTDNYKGFRFLPSEYLPAGHLNDHGLRPDYDGTRREYYA